VKPDTQRRNEILEALDSPFGSEGFKRGKASFAWKRTASREVTAHVHLNFGRYGELVRVNPSFGLRFRQVERALVALGVKSSEEGATVGWNLAELASGDYVSSLSEPVEMVASAIWADWSAVGRPFLDRVDSLDVLCELLQSEAASSWGTHRSYRARLLPTIQRVLGREAEARRLLPILGADLEGRDQNVPAFDEFVRLFVTSRSASAT